MAHYLGNVEIQKVRQQCIFLHHQAKFIEY